jgi:hypothetical protein
MAESARSRREARRGRPRLEPLANLLLCEGALEDVLADLTAGWIMATIIGGKPVHARQ